MAINEATEEEGVKEVVAKDLEVFPLFFGLRVSGDIVNKFLKGKNKSNGNCFVYFYLFGKFRGIYSWALSLQTVGPYLSRSEEQSIGQGIGNWWFKCPRFAQVSSTWAT